MDNEEYKDAVTFMAKPRSPPKRALDLLREAIPMDKKQLLANLQQLVKQVKFKPYKGIDGKGQSLDIRKEYKGEQYAVFLSREEKGPFENIYFVSKYEYDRIVSGIIHSDPFFRMKIFHIESKDLILDLIKIKEKPEITE